MKQNNQLTVIKLPQVIATKAQMFGLAVITFILLSIIFLVGFILREQLQKQDVLLSSILTNSTRAIDQAHREVVRLLVLVEVNQHKPLDPKQIQLQRNLVESRFAIIQRHHVNSDLSMELQSGQIKIGDMWRALQTPLDDWQTDLTNELLQTLIAEKLIELELQLNDIITRQMEQRTLQYGGLLEVRSRSFSLLVMVSALLFVFTGFVVYSTYCFIQERQKVLSTLQKSEEQYRRIVETAEEGIWLLDVEGQTTFCESKNV